ncbi:MAG: Smr/MutS family protein, partial [Deltaproteobacteria bacterium]|nr:Smr/MutS family protein [Deltaproteobacteria bacterium]
TLDKDAVESSLNLTHQARELLNVTPGPDFHDHLDLTEILKTLRPQGARLDPAELRQVWLEALCSTRALAFFEPLTESFPQLCAIANDLRDFSPLIEILERTLGPDGEILDTASSHLARLRMELTSARGALTLKLNKLMHSKEFESILMDDIVTTRNERFVVPVRASASGKSRGLVHDWSKSGVTAYLEPVETVEDNNRLAFLKRQERQEIERILLKISDICRESAPDFQIAGEAMTRLDLIMAKARLARIWRCSIPHLQTSGGIKLLGARHPILERRLKDGGRKIVPLDIIINPQKPITVLSGVNTGGKTVALKTLGLIVLMTLAGLPAPVGDGSEIELPRDIFTVMGDGQDLASDLSTFSGHVLALSEILQAAGNGVLIIIDELGAGTDPSEGAALGLAVLEQLKSTGAMVVAATHFHLIKSWATLTDEVVSVAVNSSHQGQPVYGLSYGSPGFSGGLSMARRLGLPSMLVDRAESFLDEGQKKAMELLKRLDQERVSLNIERESLEKSRLSFEQNEIQRQKEQRALEESYNKKASELNQQIRSALANNRREFESLKQTINQAVSQGRKPDLMSLSLKRADLDRDLVVAMPSEVETAAGENLQFAGQGDAVFLKRFGCEGQVKHCNVEKNEYTVEVGSLTVKVGLEELLKPLGKKPKRQGGLVTVTTSEQEYSLSLNLLGKTVDEAQGVIDKEIDRAILAGRDHITIIHGLGTGRLRQGVLNHLKGHSMVKKFGSPTNVPGGAGVTEVELWT